MDVTVVVSNSNRVSEHYQLHWDSRYIMNTEEVPSTVVDVVVGEEDLNMMAMAVMTSGLAETLSGEGPFTVFCPTNDAFAAINQALWNRLLQVEWALHLADLLLFHVIDGNVLTPTTLRTAVS